MAATLKQVAEHTQLSIPTVSEILNKKSNRLYRDETRMRVFAMARQLGYRPNGYARSMKTGRFGAIALLQSSHKNRSYLPNSLLSGIGTFLNERNLLLTLASVADEQLADPTFIPHILRTLSVDGLLINYNAAFPGRLVDLVRRDRIPSVWINAKPGDDCLYPDDLAASRQATNYLLALGHRKIAYVDYSHGYNLNVSMHYSTYDRSLGYSQAMQGAGLVPWEIRSDTDIAVPVHDRYEYSLRWLSLPNRPSALLTYSEGSAIPVFLAARSLGLRVPEDFSMITFNEHLTDECGVRLDTLVLPEARMAELAIRRLLEKIEDPSKIFPAEAVAIDFQKGWSTAPPAPPSPSAPTGAVKAKGRRRRAGEKSTKAIT